MRKQRSQLARKKASNYRALGVENRPHSCYSQKLGTRDLGLTIMARVVHENVHAFLERKSRTAAFRVSVPK